MYAAADDVLDGLMLVARHLRPLARLVQDLWSRGLHWQATIVALVGGTVLCGAGMARSSSVREVGNTQEPGRSAENLSLLSARSCLPLDKDNIEEPYSALSDVLTESHTSSLEDSENAEKEDLAYKAVLLANYNQKIQQQLNARMAASINEPLVTLRFSVFLHCLSQGCSKKLSHLVAEVLHPLDNHVMPGAKYTREAREIASTLAGKLKKLHHSAVEDSTLVASRELSAAAAKHGEEYYVAVHTIFREVYERWGNEQIVARAQQHEQDVKELYNLTSPSWLPLASNSTEGEPYSAISELLGDTRPGDQPYNPYLESSVTAGPTTPVEQSSTHASVAVSLPARTLLGFMIEPGDYIMSSDGRWAQVDIVVLVSEDEADLIMRSDASAPVLRVRLEEQYQIRRG
jgi:hypothetical protein